MIHHASASAGRRSGANRLVYSMARLRLSRSSVTETGAVRRFSFFAAPPLTVLTEPGDMAIRNSRRDLWPEVADSGQQSACDLFAGAGQRLKQRCIRCCAKARVPEMRFPGIVRATGFGAQLQGRASGPRLAALLKQLWPATGWWKLDCVSPFHHIFDPLALVDFVDQFRGMIHEPHRCFTRHTCPPQPIHISDP